MLYYVYIISYTFFFSRTSQGVSRFHCYILCKIVFWRYLSPSSSHLFFFLSLCARAHVHLFFFLFFFFQINVTCDSCIKCTFVLSIPMFYVYMHFIHVLYIYIYIYACISVYVYVYACVYVCVLIRVCARA